MSSPALRDQLWGIVRMARPLTLLSIFSSWFLGVAIAYGSGYEFSWTSFAYGLIVMILVSSSIHFVNEYADYETDALTRRTAYSGGSGVLPSGLVPRVWAMNAAIISAVSGLVFQGVITVVGVHTPEALVIALVGTAGGWIYSLPPRLAWRGLGETWNTLLGAWLLPYFGFVQMSGSLAPWVLVAVLPVTFFAFNNLLAVTWPDRKADAEVGKNTLATRLKPGTLKTLHGSCILLSLASFTLNGNPPLVMWSSLVAYPLMAHGWLTYTRGEVTGSTIWGLHILIIAQTLAWFYLGLRGIV